MSSKEGVEHSTVLDHEILGDKADISHEEAMHFGVLTPEELVTEKKLRRKIDSLIVSLPLLSNTKSWPRVSCRSLGTRAGC
jgi:hypothetical protein